MAFISEEGFGGKEGQVPRSIFFVGEVCEVVEGELDVGTEELVIGINDLKVALENIESVLFFSTTILSTVLGFPHGEGDSIVILFGNSLQLGVIDTSSS